MITVSPHQLRQLARHQPIVYAEDARWTPPKALPAVSPGGTTRDQQLLRPRQWPVEWFGGFLARLFGGNTAQQPGSIRYWE